MIFAVVSFRCPSAGLRGPQGRRLPATPGHALGPPGEVVKRKLLPYESRQRVDHCMVHFGVYLPRGRLHVALNIKDPETEKLAAEVAAITGESKARAVKVALQERRLRLAVRVVRRDRAEELRRFLAEEVWPQVPQRLLGKRVTRREREAILGYGPEGV